MIDLLLTHAGELLTCRADNNSAVGRALQKLEIIPDGAVAIDDGRIMDIGATAELEQRYCSYRKLCDAQGMLVSPGLIDCHSHLLYGGTRHEEYERLVSDRSGKGAPLDSGIRYTVCKTREATEESLTRQALADLDIMLAHGTTTLEVKTGYGLDRETELRILRIQSSLQHAVDLISTYLGAHVIPYEYRTQRSNYVNLVIKLLPEVKQYAEYCDVCCDPIGFTREECAKICDAALRAGFRLKVHADQSGYAGGAELAAQFHATSADHLDYITQTGISAMVNSGTVGVLLPSVTFHMMEMISRVEDGKLISPVKPFMPELVSRLIESGMRLAISADYNPGSSPSQSMQMAMQTAARLYRLNYSEIWHMSTINAAHAVDRQNEHGSIEIGKKADLVVWKVPSHGLVINRFGVNLVSTVIKNGKIVVQNQ